jgi:two-component system, NarL family, response regulator YdfI
VITVLVVARTAQARAELGALVAERKTLRVTSMPPGVSLGEQVADAPPDVLLIDVAREPVSAALSDLAGLPRPPATIVLTGDERLVWTPEMLRAGVRAVLPRHVTATEIAAAIDAVSAGLLVLHPDAAETPRVRAMARPARAERGERLTAREAEVLGMVAEGLGNKIIAARLGVSTHTVKFHVASIFEKLGAGTRTEAVTIGLRRGLIMI